MSIRLIFCTCAFSRQRRALVFKRAQPAPRTAARSCRAALLPRASRRAYPVLRTRSEFALRWCAGSFGQAHIQNTNERSMCVAMQALEAGQCVELAPGMPHI